MRLSFPNAEHPDVLAGDGVVRIGSAAGNDIELADLAEQHARLTQDVRGIVLEIAEAGARAHVNARPVREKAFVRYGDTVCLGSTSIVVSAVDPAELSEVRQTRPVHGPQSAVIRGMSGTWFGKSVAIADGALISIGRDGGAVLGETADSFLAVRFRNGTSGLIVQSEESSGSLLNGRRVMSMAVRNGDQLTLGRDRFVIECSNAKEIKEAVDFSDPDDIAAQTPADETRRSLGAMWGLRGAASMIGLIRGALLLRGF